MTSSFRNTVRSFAETFRSQRPVSAIFPLYIMSYGTYGRIICWQYHHFKESLDEKKMFDNKTIEEIFKVSQYKKNRKFLIKKYAIKGIIQSNEHRRITPQYVLWIFLIENHSNQRKLKTFLSLGKYLNFSDLGIFWVSTAEESLIKMRRRDWQGLC